MQREKTFHLDDGPSPDCSWVRENLGAWLDGELPPAARNALAGHVQQCAPCRELQRELEEDWRLLGELPGPGSRAGGAASPREFLRAVKLRMSLPEASGSAPARRGRWLRVALAAIGSAAAAALIYAGAWLFQGAPRPADDAADLASAEAADDRPIIQNLPVLEALEKEIAATVSGDPGEVQAILDSLAILDHPEADRDTENGATADDTQDILDLLLSEESEG